MARFLDDLLLQAGQLGVTHFDPEIAAATITPSLARTTSAKFAIASARSIFATSSPWPPASRRSLRASSMSAHRAGRTRRIVHLERRGRADILAILVGERAGRQAAALAVDALVVASSPPTSTRVLMRDRRWRGPAG